MLLWQRYDNNKMVVMRYYVLHLQQYSHRLNLLYFFFVYVMLIIPIVFVEYDLLHSAIHAHKIQGVSKRALQL